MANYSVIDADAHLIQLADDSDIRSCMEEPYSQVQGPIFPGIGWDPTRYGRIDPGLWNAEHHVKAMDKEGIEISALFPTRGLLVSQIPRQGWPTGRVRQMRDPGLPIAYCRGYNDYAASLCRVRPRLKAVGIVPFQDVAGSVAEIRRAVTELGLVGIAASSLGLSEHIGSPTFWPIYDELQRLHAPLLVHNLSYQVPLWHRFPDSFLFQDTVGGSMETLHSVTALMYGGIPEKFSELRIGFFNIGVGWIPYMMERMDRDFKSHGKEHAPLLKEEPSQYLTRGNWYYATLGNESTLPFVLDWVGDDVVVFGSTYPDADSSFPNAVSNFRKRGDVSEQSKKKILCDNAKRLFGLG
jgi:predicted TIM-barrel fold metal-dependent hydrolase